jgi:hypothetical protein
VLAHLVEYRPFSRAIVKSTIGINDLPTIFLVTTLQLIVKFAQPVREIVHIAQFHDLALQ